MPTAYPALARFAAGVALVASVATLAAEPDLDRAAERWVSLTLKALTVDEKVGQLLMAQVASTYIGSDSAEFDRASAFIRDQRVGGFVVSGGAEAAPNVLLNTAYGSVTLGQPLERPLINRLQSRRSAALVAADFEGGRRFRIAGATLFPKAMAFGATGDEHSLHRGAMSARKRGRSACTSTSRRSPTSTQPEESGDQHALVRRDPASVGAFVSAGVRGLAAAAPWRH